MFRSEDGGDTWSPIDGFNNHPMQQEWVGGDQDQTQDGGKTHSVLVDLRDADHMYLGLSGGGFFETADAGASWTPLNSGVAIDFAPARPDGGEHEHGHAPHCVQLAPSNPARLWRQDHRGLYRLDRDQGRRWVHVGDAMPKEVGDFGFPVAVHPANADRAWVFPMDGTSVWPRTSPGGRPALYRTRDAGLATMRSGPPPRTSVVDGQAAMPRRRPGRQPAGGRLLRDHKRGGLGQHRRRR